MSKLLRLSALTAILAAAAFSTSVPARAVPKPLYFSCISICCSTNVPSQVCSDDYGGLGITTCANWNAHYLCP